MNNIAFIDGQNLYMGTTKSTDKWKVDLSRFYIYLQKKYNVSKAYYFLGYTQDEHQGLYEEIQEAGFILVFKQHNPAMIGKKKGNVDTDIVFHIMKKLYRKDGFDKIILVSGDGDYKILVDFLLEESKFEKILFPNKKYASSLYKQLGRKYFAHLEDNDVKKKISR
jgi:uncharacterized LabA/DUF88 family protein